jgi:hypothetical protein
MVKLALFILLWRMSHMEQNFQVVNVLDQAMCVKDSHDFPFAVTTNKDSRKYGLSGMKGKKFKEHKGQ